MITTKMEVKMHYEINISKNNIHVLATHGRSCYTAHDANKLFILLLKKFPLKEGYELELIKSETVNHIIHKSGGDKK